MPGLGRADLHLHTNFSDGWPTPEQVVRHVVARRSLDVIAITDHDTIEGALRAADYSARLGGPPVVVGEEVSSRDGHIVGLWLTRRILPGQSAAATVHAIHDQGGIAFAAHPFWRTERQARGGRVHGVGWLAGELEFDAIEVENSTPGFYVFNQLASRLNAAARKAALGNSDAHILDAVGTAYTVFPGKGEAALRKAIERRLTAAERERHRMVGLVRYAAWTVNHQRVRALAAT